MTAVAESRRSRPILEVLALELAAREGRWAAVARISTGSVLAVIVAMVFQIPQPAYMAYIGFLLSKDEKRATVTSALGGLVAVTLATLLTLSLEFIDASEPALRLPLMAFATFVAMFTTRTFALGPISFVAGFVIVLLQSLIDDVKSPEALTRTTLWAWVIVLVPVVVTVVVNLLFGQGAVAFMDRTVRKVLTELEASLAGGDRRMTLAEWRARLVPLLEIAQQSTNKDLRTGRVTVPVIRVLLEALVILESVPSDQLAAAREHLASVVRACRRAVESGETIAPHSPAIDAGFERSPAVVALFSTLAALYTEVGHADSAPDKAAARQPPRRLFIPDAFSNPVNWQFALKGTIAVMISYAIFTLLDWPGLRTAIVTCFFVALASLGETVHKLVLRLSGAVIGGLIAGLSIVFVLPHLTDIGQLCLLIAGVSVGAAWVATSSELLSYAGMQIAFAFFLGVLQSYAPPTDLTVLRDRIAGILLGNIVITIVFSSLWPQSARSSVRAALAEALRGIGAVIRRPADTEEARMRTVQALTRADHMHTLSLFELRMLPNHARESVGVPPLATIERLAGAAFIASTDAISHYAEPGSTIHLAEWAESAADNILTNCPVPPSPVPTATSLATALQPDASLKLRAIEQLESEVQHVASAAH